MLDQKAKGGVHLEHTLNIELLLHRFHHSCLESFLFRFLTAEAETGTLGKCLPKGLLQSLSSFNCLIEQLDIVIADCTVLLASQPFNDD